MVDNRRRVHFVGCRRRKRRPARRQVFAGLEVRRSERRLPAGRRQGYFADEGLDVTVDTGQGSLEAIPRVASGVYQFGFADINSLIKFHDKNPEVGIKGILMVYDAPPFAIVTLAKTGIETPKDLEGHILGAPAPDGAYAQWKAFVKANGIDASKVTIENVGFPLREPMLVAGKVDAITGSPSRRS